jgi:hypothetical protein
MFLHYTMIIAGPDYWAGRYSPSLSYISVGLRGSSI